MKPVRKGKTGEREVVGILRELGLPVGRSSYGQQAAGLPDVMLGEIAIEVKRTERPTVRQWASILGDYSADGQLAMVAWRPNRGDWLAIMPLADLRAIAARLCPRCGLQSRHNTGVQNPIRSIEGRRASTIKMDGEMAGL